MAIGQKIRDIREDLGMQGSVLARRVGVAPNTIYRIEHGERTPSVALLQKIARELRVEPAELLKEPVSLGEAPDTGRRIHHRAVHDSVPVSDSVKATIFGHLDALEAALKTHNLNGELVDMIEQMRKKVAA